MKTKNIYDGIQNKYNYYRTKENFSGYHMKYLDRYNISFDEYKYFFKNYLQLEYHVSSNEVMMRATANLIKKVNKFKNIRPISASENRYPTDESLIADSEDMDEFFKKNLENIEKEIKKIEMETKKKKIFFWYAFIFLLFVSIGWFFVTFAKIANAKINETPQNTISIQSLRSDLEMFGFEILNYSGAISTAEKNINTLFYKNRGIEKQLEENNNQVENVKNLFVELEKKSLK